MNNKMKIMNAVENVLQELFCRGKKGEDRVVVDNVVKEFLEEVNSYSAEELESNFNTAEVLINVFDAYYEVKSCDFGPTLH
ncbi:MAG: hypothetical protein GY714_24580 [Desulfobacterales bacterium]|nr:hypothetical protein [Desulfobacterales bacterium]